MKNNLNIDGKIERCDHLVNSAARIKENLFSLTKEQFEKVKKAYLSLRPDQDNLISSLAQLNEWSNVDAIIDKAEKYIQRLEDTVLNPEREEILNSFRQWLQNLNIELESSTEEWLKESLKNAAHVYIKKLEDKLKLLSSLEKLEAPLLDYFVVLVNREISEFSKLARTPNNFSEFLDRTTQVIEQALELQNKWKNIRQEMNSKYASSPQNEIVKKFDSVIGELIKRLKEKRKLDEADIQKIKQDVNLDWDTLTRKLATIKDQYEALSDTAKALVSKEINEWKPEKTADIHSSLDSLSKKVGGILQAKDILNKINAHIASLEKISPEILTHLEQLVNEFKQIGEDASKLSSLSSLEEYKESFEHLSERYKQWISNLKKEQERRIAKAESWKDLCSKAEAKLLPSLEQKLNALKNVDCSKDTIEEISLRYQELENTIKEIRNALKETLPEEELQIFSTVAKFEAEKGEVLLTDLKEQFESQVLHFGSLLKLAEKKLLSVKISTRR